MKWIVEREVEEWIEVEAEDEYEAGEKASEMPIEEWMRDVHEERATEAPK